MTSIAFGKGQHFLPRLSLNCRRRSRRQRRLRHLYCRPHRHLHCVVGYRQKGRRRRRRRRRHVVVIFLPLSQQWISYRAPVLHDIDVALNVELSILSVCVRMS